MPAQVDRNGESSRRIISWSGQACAPAGVAMRRLCATVVLAALLACIHSVDDRSDACADTSLGALQAARRRSGGAFWTRVAAGFQARLPPFHEYDFRRVSEKVQEEYFSGAFAKAAQDIAGEATKPGAARSHRAYRNVGHPGFRQCATECFAGEHFGNYFLYLLYKNAKFPIRQLAAFLPADQVQAIHAFAALCREDADIARVFPAAARSPVYQALKRRAPGRLASTRDMAAAACALFRASTSLIWDEVVAHFRETPAESAAQLYLNMAAQGIGALGHVFELFPVTLDVFLAIAEGAEPATHACIYLTLERAPADVQRRLIGAAKDALAGGNYALYVRLVLWNAHADAGFDAALDRAAAAKVGLAILGFRDLQMAPEKMRSVCAFLSTMGSRRAIFTFLTQQLEAGFSSLRVGSLVAVLQAHGSEEHWLGVLFVLLSNPPLAHDVDRAAAELGVDVDDPRYMRLFVTAREMRARLDALAAGGAAAPQTGKGANAVVCAAAAPM